MLQNPRQGQHRLDHFTVKREPRTDSRSTMVYGELDESTLLDDRMGRSSHRRPPNLLRESTIRESDPIQKVVEEAELKTLRRHV